MRRQGATWRDGGKRLGRAASVFAVGLASLIPSGAVAAQAAQATPSDADAGTTVSATPTVVSVLATTDGAAPFDPSEGPGLDTGDANGVIRTNDRIDYDIEISVNGGDAEQVAYDLALPPGLSLAAVPPYCESGSTLVPPVLGEPVVPLTSTSWADLGAQHLHCVVGERAAFSSVSYPVSATVRPEVPNGTVLDAPLATVSIGETRFAEIAGRALTVSAAPRFDLSVNSTATRIDSGYLARQGLLDCADGSGRKCYQYVLPILVGAEGDGIGSAPLDGGFGFVDDLSIEATYGADALEDPEYLAAGDQALERYGAILLNCRGLNWSQPNGRLGLGDTSDSVRDSGTTTCSQPDGPGTPVAVAVEGLDSTLYTQPTHVARPSDTPIQTGLGYVYSHAITVQIPLAAVLDLGVPAADGNGATLDWIHSVRDFSAVALDGTPNDPVAQTADDDRRTVRQQANAAGSFDLYFVGVPGTRGNVPTPLFNQGWAIFEGPAAGDGAQTGNGQIMAGQPTASVMTFDARAGATGDAVSFVGCQSWLADELHLRAADIPGSETARAQWLPSEGVAVWLSGRNFDRRYLTADNDVHRPELTIEYGTGAPGSSCGDTDSPDGWFSDPAEVAGNDPALAAGGVFTAVTQVRVHAVLPPESTGVGNWAWVSVSLLAADDLGVGEVVSIEGSYKRVFADATLAAVLAGAESNWIDSRYDRATNVGRLGDRLTVTGATVRVENALRGAGTEAWLETVAASGNRLVDLRLSPTLGAAADFDVALPVRVEHCLPAGLSYVSSSVDPQIVRDGSPADAEIVCALGRTYLRWELTPQLVNTPVVPVDLTARVSPLAPSGVRTGSTSVSTPLDASPLDRRIADLELEIVQPAGVDLDLASLTPLTERNAPDEGAPAALRWRVELGRSGGDGAGTDDLEPEAVDAIVLLPFTGVAGSRFSGDVELAELRVRDAAGGAVAAELWATAADPTLVSLDANDGSNDLIGGATQWCRVGEDPGCGLASVSGVATTAVRMRATHRLDRSALVADLVLLPTGNVGGDLYSVAVAARAEGLDLPIGPSRAVARIVASSVEVTVFADREGDGVRDAVDGPVAGHRVALSGTDVDGNEISRSVVTDSDGIARFEGLTSGRYTVAVDAPTGDSVFTHRDVGGDERVDSDVDPVTGDLTIDLSPNTNLYDLGAGLSTPASVEGTVVDGRGEPLPGVVVTLAGIDDTGSIDPIEVVSDAAGVWTFDRLRPGTYLVAETQPTGHGQGDTSPGPAGVLVTDDVIEFVLEPGAVATGAVFAETYASLGGVVRWDRLPEGDTAEVEAGTDRAHPGDTGIAGVVLTLLGIDADGVVVSRTAATDAEGAFVFDGLLAGTYDLLESQPAAYVDGIDIVGDAGGVVGDDRISGIVVEAGATVGGYAFTETGVVVEGVVWLDTDLDGTLDGEEFGRVEGATLVLRSASAEVSRTVTGPDGGFVFHGVLPGTYELEEMQPVGYGSTTANILDLALGAVGVSDLHFGENLGRIAGLAWDDLDGDGVRLRSEPLRPDLELRLLAADGSVVATTWTGDDGTYVFDRLLAAQYRVEPVLGDVFAPTVPQAGPLPSANSDIDWATGTSSILALQSEGCVGGLGGACPPPVPERDAIDIGVIAAESDLSVLLSASSATAREGRALEWSVAVANPGPTPQRNPILTVAIPASLRNATASGEGWTCSTVGQQASCRYDDYLPPRADAPLITIDTVVAVDQGTVEVEARVAPGARGIVEITPGDNVAVAGILVERPPSALALTGSTPAVAGLGLVLVAVGLTLRSASRATRVRRS